MAIPLSSYFNWENSFQTLNDIPDMNSYCSLFHEQTPPPPPPPPADFSDHDSFFFLNNNNDNPNNLLFDYCYSFPAESTYPPPPPPQYQTPLSHYNNNNIFPTIDDDQTFQCPYPKRRKLSYENNHHQIPYQSDKYFCDGFDQASYMNPFSSSCLMPEFNYGIGVPPVPPLRHYPAPAASEHGEKNYWSGAVGREVKTEERTVSAQSVAARERRKKIAEKTVELGKMVPGGSKMNTAEMLLAASKYVKYLQAQVSMLELMNDINTPTEDKSSTWSDDQNQQLQAMLGSANIEEKLYLQEKCLVPQHLVTTLINHSDIQTRPSILKDLNQLITVSDTEKKQLH